MAEQPSIQSNLGLYVYGGAAMLLGILGLVSGDFATSWQNIGPNIPLRAPLAYLTAAIELAGGIVLLLPRTARIGALALTIVYSAFTLIWVPKAFVNLGNYDPIGNVFEEFSLVAAGLVLCAIFSSADSTIARRRHVYVLLFGICPISFGIAHIIDMPGLLNWIPDWLPPTRMFWAYATTIGFFGAAVAILTGIMAPLAARLLTAEILIFELLVWIPNLYAGPNNHFNWAGNLHRFGRRCLGCLRLDQRGGKNQVNPSRIRCRREHHPRLNLSLAHHPCSIDGRPPSALRRYRRTEPAPATIGSLRSGSISRILFEPLH
jgi:uncharacterized membrane protein YphA (DoxX/SURF4 family)